LGINCIQNKTLLRRREKGEKDRDASTTLRETGGGKGPKG